jgi:hypothetical protein
MTREATCRALLSFLAGGRSWIAGEPSTQAAAQIGPSH